MVAVATVDLFWGTTLTADLIRLVPFPSESVLAGYFSTVESVQGRILITDTKTNEPILDAKLTPPNVTPGDMAAVTQASGPCPYASTMSLAWQASSTRATAWMCS
jgi:pilus assembly protein CpaB